MGAICKCFRRKVEDNTLLADDRRKINGDVNREFLRRVFIGKEQQEAVVRPEKGDRLFDGAIAERGGIQFDDTDLLDGFDDRHGTDIEQRRIARRRGDDDVV